MRLAVALLRILAPAVVAGLVICSVWLLVDVHQRLSLYHKEIEWLELYARSLDGKKMEKQFFMGDRSQLTDDLLSSEHVVIYNKIPKSGSTSLAGLAYDLCVDNSFTVIHVNISRNRPTLSLIDQRSFVRNVSTWQRVKPAFYHGHFAFIDFSRFGSALQPLYINIVREPLERLVSYFYFLRYGDDFRPDLKRARAQDQDTSLDDCVQKNGADCDIRKHVWLQIPFFCGQQPACWQPGSEWALQQAKHNLLHRYFLVGVTEMLEDFVLLLEHSLPQMFAGATNAFAQNGRSHLRRTQNKQQPSAKTVEILRQSRIFQLEEDFYNFAKQNFLEVFQKTVASKTDAVLLKDMFSYDKIRPKISASDP